MQVNSQRRYRLFLIVLVYLVVAIHSVSLGFSSEITREDWLYSIIIAFVLTQICVVDSRISGKALPPNSYWLVLITYPVTVPVLIIRNHGLKGLGILVIHLLGLALTWFVTFLITDIIVYGSFFPFENF